MLLPAWILIPRQFLEPACQRDQIGLAVVIDIGNNNLVTTTEIGGDCVLRKLCLRNAAVSWSRAKEIGRNDAGSNSNDQRSHNHLLFVRAVLILLGKVIESIGSKLLHRRT